jgi:hypothetical protein
MTGRHFITDDYLFNALSRYLLFHLQQQHLIELIREQNIEEALQYSAEHLAERGEEDKYADSLGVLHNLETLHFQHRPAGAGENSCSSGF